MVLSYIFPQIGKRKTGAFIIFMDWYNMRHLPGIQKKSTINTIFKSYKGSANTESQMFNIVIEILS